MKYFLQDIFSKTILKRQKEITDHIGGQFSCLQILFDDIVTSARASVPSLNAETVGRSLLIDFSIKRPSTHKRSEIEDMIA